MPNVNTHSVAAQRRTRRSSRVGGGALVALLTAACAANTTTREGRIAGEREVCRGAAAVLAKNTPTRETFATLAWCDESGPPALASVWQALPTDTVRVRAFLAASSNLRDERIYSAAFATASDATRKPRDRGAALLTLVAQLDAAAAVGVTPATRAEVWRAQLLHESHPSQIAGTRPLPADARARVTALIDRLAVGVPAGAAGLRDPLGVAIQAARLDLRRLPR
jgi:hypothetical protein